MQILEIYIHTIIYIHIHTYTTSSTTTHTTHTTGGRGVLIHSYTYIYNFFHHHPPPPTPPTPQGGGGYTTTHHHPPPPTTTHHHPHHPHHRGEGGTGALLYRPITMGWGGGEVPSDAGPYIHTLYMFMFVSGSFFHFATQVQDVDGSCCGRYWSRRAQRFKLRSAQWNCAQVPAWGYLRVMKMHTAKK